MENILRKDIEIEAKDKIDRFNRYHNHLELDHQRNKRRIVNPPMKNIKLPEEWNDSRLHNPFYVYRHRKQIARSISKKILKNTYKPNPPYEKDIPKKAGGTRRISIYQIPDAAVSDRIYKNLLSKNRHRFSSLSYAYRNDRNVHYAIQDIALEFKNKPRIYIAEFDFSNFFGSIPHEFIFDQLTKNSFLVSNLELNVIKAFLSTFERGIPLGTSISLFLANIACWSLDRRLEDQGIRFARYADDTIIWSSDYNKIVRAFDIITDFSNNSNIPINFAKSDGISLMQKKELKSELINSKEYVEFLGYKISSASIGIKNSSVRKIKNQISYLLYRNLIQPILTTPFKAMNLPANDMDKDFITAIMQIRRYMYGNMTEVTLKKYLNGTYKKLSFKGIMSFYPLVDDIDQMKELDKWIVSTLLNVFKKRKQLLLAYNPNFNTNQFPFNCNKDDLILKCKNESVYGKKGLIQIPSFLRIHKAIKIGLTNEGIDRVMHPKSNHYYE